MPQAMCTSPYGHMSSPTNTLHHIIKCLLYSSVIVIVDTITAQWVDQSCYIYINDSLICKQIVRTCLLLTQ